MICDGPIELSELGEAEVEGASLVGEEGGVDTGDDLGDVVNGSACEGWEDNGFGISAHGGWLVVNSIVGRSKTLEDVESLRTRVIKEKRGV